MTFATLPATWQMPPRLELKDYASDFKDSVLCLPIFRILANQNLDYLSKQQY